MGSVYKARDINLDRLVAIKTLSNDLARDPEFIARFRREASLAAKLDHPNLIRVYSAGEAEGTYYIVMELVEGESARERLTRDGKLPLAEVLTIGIFVAEALDYGWQRAKLIHRDIKPANIFLSNNGQVKLGDLGLAKSAGENSGLTTTGQAVGTPFYISPEQGLGEKEVDFRSDIYSLGCTLYHLITGEPPYACPSSMAVVHKHIYDPPPAILEKIPDCPMSLALLLAKMMAKKPDARHQSYSELIAKMQRAHYQLLEPIAPPPSKAASIPSALRLNQQRSHTLAYFVVAASLITIGTGLWVWEPWKSGFSVPVPLPARNQTEATEQTPPSADALVAEIASLPAEQQVQRVLTRLQQLNPGFDGQSTPKIEDGLVIELKLSSAALTDISPLRALTNLRRLTCNGSMDNSPLADLSPLHSLRLEALDCGKSQVSDLTPLTAMPIQELCCSTTLVNDLSPLRNAPLIKLDLFHTSVSDLSPLAKCPIRWLNCKTTRIEDLTPLRDMPLEELYCDAPLLARHAALLRAIPTLKSINSKPAMDLLQAAAAHTPTITPPSSVTLATVADTSLPPEQQFARVIARLRQLNPGFAGDATHAIENGKVTGLSLTVTSGLSDLSPLLAVVSLRNFECIVNAEECLLLDLRPLRGLLLVELTLRHVTVTDLSPLGGMPLEVLCLDSCSIPDLSAVKGMHLKRLSLWSSTVSDLAPLAGMPLEWLNCTGTKVRDFSPLRGARLVQLFCDNTSISDLSPLRDMPLRILRCNLETAKQNATVLQSIPTLENINGVPAAEFWKNPKAP
jgi:serine/threonine protein kinase